MDDAQCGPEWPLKCTIPDFKKNCVIKFTLEDNDRFTIFGRCLFGLGSTYWDEVLSKIAGRTNADSDEAIKSRSILRRLPRSKTCRIPSYAG